MKSESKNNEEGQQDAESKIKSIITFENGSERLTKAKRQQDAGADQEKIFENRIGRSKVRGFDPFLSPKEAAEYLGVSVRFIYERMASNAMESQPMGRLRRVRLSTLENWLIRQQNGEAI